MPSFENHIKSLLTIKIGLGKFVAQVYLRFLALKLILIFYIRSYSNHFGILILILENKFILIPLRFWVLTFTPTYLELYNMLETRTLKSKNDKI